MSKHRNQTNPSDEQLNQDAEDTNVAQDASTPAAPEPAAPDNDVQKALAEVAKMKKELEKMQAAQIKREQELDAREASLKGTPSAAMEVVRQTHSAKSLATKESLEKQPKVRMMIPLEGGEKIGVTIPVTINGHRVNVPKGVYVNVPEQIADMLMESFNQTELAGRDFRVDLRQDKAAQDALTS